MDIEVNFLAIFLSGVAYMAIGFAWYSALLFGKPWMKIMGYTEKILKEKQKKMGPKFALSFLAALVTAFVLSHVTTMSVNFFGYARLTSALTSAFWMWLGFMMPVQLTDVIFEEKPVKLFAINTGYQLTALMAMGIIIGLM